MYLLLSDKDKIILDTVQELEMGGFQLDKYKIYNLSPIDPSELINDGQIRDMVCHILRGDQMSKNELIEKVITNIDIPKSKVSKVITKMKKEKVIYDIEDWNYIGERIIGMDK